MRRAHKILRPKGDAEAVVPRKGEMLLVNAGEIATMAGHEGPRRGEQMKDVGIVADGAIYAREGRIVEVGGSRSLLAKYQDVGNVIDAEGRLVVPGFVDPHTHVVFAGSREDELEMKLGGATYEDVASSGGGIASTLTQTRAASVDELVSQSSKRLRGMLGEGTTTCEAKSGYGLTIESELNILFAIEKLAEAQPVKLVSTFLGAHAIPPEYKGDPDGYIDMLVDNLLPQVVNRTTARFCDVWVEQGYFNVEQGGRYLTRAKHLGLTPKVHADELTACGGAELAVEVGAVSADHLVHVSDDALQALSKSECVAVLLPAASMAFRIEYADARRIISSGTPVALGSDLNPGCWAESMQFVISLAIHKLRMHPSEALTAATINAAYAIQAQDEVGSLEPGKSADFIVLDVPNHRRIGYQFGRNHAEIVVRKGIVQVDRRLR